jgi:hypothetical protein
VNLKDEAKVSRRWFLRQTSAGLAAAGMAGAGEAALGDPHPGPQAKTPTTPHVAGHGAASVIAANALKPYRIWDDHLELSNFAGTTVEAKVHECLRTADRMHVERMLLISVVWEREFRTPAELREGNDLIMKAVKMAPDRFFGCAFLYPGALEACLDEIDRCVRDGPLIGIKIKLDSPAGADSPDVDAIFDRCAQYQAVVMHHTWIITTGDAEGESTPMQLAAVARRHPTVPIFCGHTGGNWELGIHAMRGVKNLYADLAGTDPQAGFTEMAVRVLGPERVVYGADPQSRSWASQIGKVMGANISDATRRMIFCENLRRILQPSLKVKGITA